MITRVLRVEDDPERDAAVGEAAEVIRGGGLAAFPTETVYGLGADATSASAVEAVYAVKERPLDNPLIVHIAEMGQLEEAAELPDGRARRLAEAFWPGPLTLVLPAREPVRSAVCRGLETVAVRMPDHPVALALIRRSGRPVAAPSANLSGRPSPTTARHVLDDLGGRIPLILDGGPCRVGIESTVLDLSSGPACILRPGGVTLAMLEKVLGEPVEPSLSAPDAPRSPGIRGRHYQPHAPLWLVGENVGDEALGRCLDSIGGEQKLGYIGSRQSVRRRPDVLSVPKRLSQEESARHLYADLRELDRQSVALILADIPQGAGLAASLRDRLNRAASAVLLEEGGEARADLTQRRQAAKTRRKS